MNQKTLQLPARIVINISGHVYETFEDTLSFYPETLLGNPAKRIPYYNEGSNQFVFVRNASCFDAILFYYQSRGILKRPENVDRKIFEQEVAFFELSTPCNGYLEHENAATSERYIRRFAIQIISMVFEQPLTTKSTIFVGFLNTALIILYVVIYCIATLPQFLDKTNEVGLYAEYAHVLSKIEAFCMGLFTIEYVIRLYSSSSRSSFLFSTLGLIELVTMISFYVSLLTDKFKQESSLLWHLFSFSRLCCGFQVLRLARFSDGLRGLLETVIKGIWHVQPVIVVIPVMVMAFASLLFHAEVNESSDKSQSLFDWIWFAVITMTTVGYGDIYPKTILGKILAISCAIFGVLFFCFLTPTMLKYFFKFYYVPRYLNKNDSKEDALMERLEDFFYSE